MLYCCFRFFFFFFKQKTAYEMRISDWSSDVCSSDLFPVTPELAESAWCDEAAYFKLYEQSIADPEGFWGEHGKRLHWFKPYTQVKDTSFGADDVHIRWFADGTTNACYNCIDRHLPAKKDDTAKIGRAHV